MTETKICGKCGERPAGPGSVLCPECAQAIDQALNDVWSTPSSSGTDSAVRKQSRAPETPGSGTGPNSPR
jgi:hypothetical protein